MTPCRNLQSIDLKGGTKKDKAGQSEVKGQVSDPTNQGQTSQEECCSVGKYSELVFICCPGDLSLTQTCCVVLNASHPTEPPQLPCNLTTSARFVLFNQNVHHVQEAVAILLLFFVNCAFQCV